MAFDGIITRGIVSELSSLITGGRIDKIYQPEKEDLLILVHKDKKKYKLLVSANPKASRVYLSTENFENPKEPSGYCMFMRKALQGGKILSIKQKDAERIIEILTLSTDEMGFEREKILILEIMGKHSNIILIDKESKKVLECIKRISIDTSSIRPMFPGIIYSYPPSQDKIPFCTLDKDTFEKIPDNSKSYLNNIAGISPSIARELEANQNPFRYLEDIILKAESYPCKCHMYVDDEGNFKEYSIGELWLYEGVCKKIEFDTISPAIQEFYRGKKNGDQVSQRSNEIKKHLKTLLDKLYLKLQRLKEDLLVAENSEDLRLYGELLTANIHLEKKVPEKSKEISVYNYYTDENIIIPLDKRFSLGKNAQIYYKRYAKSKTAIKEKKLQILETKADIDYLESTYLYIDEAKSVEEVKFIRKELEETGFVKKKKSKMREKLGKPMPRKYTSPSGYTVLVGHNNKENDYITTKLAVKKDLWFHTKDIPGSHVLLESKGENVTNEDIEYAASIAAWFSKDKNSTKVPVDYTEIKNIKKPKGSKPGMVVFYENKTLLIDPVDPDIDIKTQV